MTASSQASYCYVGVDLALRAPHVLVLADDKGCHIGPAIAFGQTFSEFQSALRQVQDRVPAGTQLIWGAEPTSSAWRPFASFLQHNGYTLVLEKTVKVHDLRRVYNRHYKADPVCASTVAQALRTDVEQKVPLPQLPSPALQAQRSLARRIAALTRDGSSNKNRLRSLLCDGVLPSLGQSPHEWHAASILRVLHRFADVRNIAKLSLNDFIRRATRPTCGGPRTSQAALTALHQAARDSVLIYGEDATCWDVHASLLRETIETIWSIDKAIDSHRETLTRLVDEHSPEPTRACGTTVPGVGDKTLTELCAFLGPVDEWRPLAAIKQFAGLVPVVKNSGTLRNTPVMSKLGEPTIRRVVHQIGNTARIYDAQFAQHYHRQMVDGGKSHTTACIATGLHVLNVLRAVLRDQRPYQPRDPETHQPITKQQSRELAADKYRVPEHIRNQRRRTQKTQKSTATGTREPAV